jgi:hypothetical protein
MSQVAARRWAARVVGSGEDRAEAVRAVWAAALRGEPEAVRVLGGCLSIAALALRRAAAAMPELLLGLRLPEES